ncbi:hypothetical protein V5O48_011800 [Marasmius crinis-equi]|uniref:F-box domain-containing protein n=1 Tax=Marasmius crinis-equi TaxID=585013 RepID=A0ABR3F4K0_9AGAR
MFEPSSSEPRRSKRARKQTAYDDGTEAEGTAEETGRLPKKRKKTGSGSQETKSKGVEKESSNTRRARGLLQRLKEFPLDVVFVIFSHLTPQDLLHLARTNKDLRSIILSRSTLSVWKEARSNVEGLPDPPDDMFFSRAYFRRDSQSVASIAIANILQSIYFGTIEPEPVTRVLNNHQKFVANRFAKGPENFACSREIWERCLEEWENNNQDDVWLEHQVAEAKIRHEHAKQLKNWWRGRVKEHESGLAVKRKARADAIFQRLAELGWKEELDLQRDRDGLSCLEKFRIGTQAKKLSEKDWDDLRPKLEAALREAKAGRLQSELCTKWTKRYSQFVRLRKAELDKLPFNTVGPSMSDYANLPQFQKKLFLPIENELVEDDLSDLFGQMPQIREEWIQARKEDLVEVLKKNGMTDATLETLNSAATIFACGTCGARCVYPRPLMHKCLRGLENSSHRGIARGEPSFDDFLLFANVFRPSTDLTLSPVSSSTEPEDDSREHLKRKSQVRVSPIPVTPPEHRPGSAIFRPDMLEEPVPAMSLDDTKSTTIKPLKSSYSRLEPKLVITPLASPRAIARDGSSGSLTREPS